ncbi:MAG: beta-propeller fold lactonase family protein [bacterium]
MCKLPKGSGPRHLVFSPKAPYAYVICEKSNQIIMMSYDKAKGTLQPKESCSLIPPKALRVFDR